MTNVTPDHFFRICWLGGCEHAGAEESVRAVTASTATPTEQDRHMEAGILRRSRESHLVHDEKIGIASAASAPLDCPDKTPCAADARMPDFVFGVLRKQTSAAITGQEALLRPDDASAPSAAAPDHGAGSPRAAATGRKKISAQLFISYALKARR